MLARLPRPIALLIAALLIAASLWCFVSPSQQVPLAKPGQYTDMRLYRDIVTQVQAGKPYHQAAAELQRANGYPLKPFITVREPTLAWLAARFGWDALQKVAGLLVLANIGVWLFAMPTSLTKAERIGALFGIVSGSVAVAVPAAMPISELWCGLLISIALGLTIAARRHWWGPMVVIAAALALREMALPFLLLAGVFAAWERRWKELAGWSIVLAGFLIGMGFHAAAVLEQVRPGDPGSPGWLGLVGLSGVLMALDHTSAAIILWQPLGLFVCLLPVLGWGAMSGRNWLFALLLLLGYALMIALFSRPDIFYWGFLISPSWFAGLALVPRGMWQLGRAIAHAPTPLAH